MCGLGYPPFTVGTDADGETRLVHFERCASRLSVRRQEAAQRRAKVKTAGFSFWTAKLVPDRRGWTHELPCRCHAHRGVGKPGSGVSYS